MHSCEAGYCDPRRLHAACLCALGRRANGVTPAACEQVPPPRLARRDARRPANGVEPTGRGDQPGVGGQGGHLALGARAAGCGFSFRDTLLRPRDRGRSETRSSGRSRGAGFGRSRLPRRERLPCRSGAQRPPRRASDGRGDREPALLDGVGERLIRTRAGSYQAQRPDGDPPAPGPQPEALGRFDPHGLAGVCAPAGSRSETAAPGGRVGRHRGGRRSKPGSDVGRTPLAVSGRDPAAFQLLLKQRHRARGGGPGPGR